MIQDFAAYIRNLAVFLIFTTFAVVVIPNSKYKSYINLTLGFIMIFLILGPVNSFLKNADGKSFDDLIVEFSNKLNVGGEQKPEIVYDETRNELILAAYESSINEQIKALVNKDNHFSYISSGIIVDASEENFGDIVQINLDVGEMTEQEKNLANGISAKPFIRIEPVKINTNDIFSSKYAPQPDKTDDGESEEIKNLKNLFSDFYNLSYDNIHITVQKKNQR